jgi:hypothetical protein
MAFDTFFLIPIFFGIFIVFLIGSVCICGCLRRHRLAHKLDVPSAIIQPTIVHQPPIVTTAHPSFVSYHHEPYLSHHGHHESYTMSHHGHFMPSHHGEFHHQPHGTVMTVCPSTVMVQPSVVQASVPVTSVPAASATLPEDQQPPPYRS